MTRSSATKFVFHLLAFLIILIPSGCEQNKTKLPAKKPELLIYCGMTMVKPMKTIAAIIEQKHSCKIHFITDGSGNLFRSLKSNRIGDLYFPGSSYYIQQCEKENLLTESVLLCYNQAALIVMQGNPKNIKAELHNLADPAYLVILGNPDSGSIGRESREILEKHKLFQQAMENAIYLAADSQDITNTFRRKEADLAINWYATSVWRENSHIDALLLQEADAPHKKLILGLLSFSSQPEIARDFMRYASSPAGREIFHNYGFLPPKL